jgi:hypothetical protein
LAIVFVMLVKPSVVWYDELTKVIGCMLWMHSDNSAMITVNTNLKEIEMRSECTGASHSRLSGFPFQAAVYVPAFQ